MKLNVTAIVERTSDGMYSCFVKENLGNYGIAGYGNTADEAKEDMLACYKEMRELNAEEGIETPELLITYKYDVQSFFNAFPYFKISLIASEAGMNPSLLRRYACGREQASETQYCRLRGTLHNIQNKLSAATF